jgi:hypothetical protein|tara:strand:+ start:3336 stop:4187 length:852 start_codon:yes stop_codon:yes gene_type:complete
MTNNEISNIDNLSNEQIMSMIGQEKSSTGNFLPKLSINRFPENDDGAEVPVGSYGVYVPELDSLAYGKPVTFRPFINAYQYMKYDADKNEYSNRSIIFKSWKDEAIDAKGGVRCGKIPAKELANLSEEERTKQKAVKCYRLIYGLVSFDGVLPGGAEAHVTNLPVLWKVTGSNFKPVGEAIESLRRRGKVMFNHTLTLKTKKKKAGSNVFYVSDITVDKDEVSFTDAEKETLLSFQETINTENEEIVELWRQAKKAEPISVKATKAEVVDAEFEDDPIEVLSS